MHLRKQACKKDFHASTKSEIAVRYESKWDSTQISENFRSKRLQSDEAAAFDQGIVDQKRG
jgi:hypothetical protein